MTGLILCALVVAFGTALYIIARLYFRPTFEVYLVRNHRVEQRVAIFRSYGKASRWVSRQQPTWTYDIRLKRDGL